MFYINELTFLCDVFGRSHINAFAAPADELVARMAAESGGLFGTTSLLDSIIPTFEEKTVYRLTDSFEFCYSFLRLPATEGDSLLAIGPYLSAPVSAQRVLEIAESNGISPSKQKHLIEYYSGTPVLTADSHLWIMLNSFCERIWRSAGFLLKDISGMPASEVRRTSDSGGITDPADILVSMKTMERRYSFENELIRAVELGRIHMEERLLSLFSAELFEKRVTDPVRNAKNYGIIMNTLLRKAAERGGVHPVYIDKLSSELAMRIESLTSLSESSALMSEIFRSYCMLVREHSMRDLPEIVQKTVLIIDADLSADLAPHSIAESLGVSLGYLGSVFKKALGQTMTAYIRERRMEHACYLLRTTSLQIQTVASHCGMVDLQYFSKVFKAHTGMTPSQYRNG